MGLGLKVCLYILCGLWVYHTLCRCNPACNLSLQALSSYGAPQMGSSRGRSRAPEDQWTGSSGIRKATSS